MKLEEIVLFLLKNGINAMWVVMAVVLLRLLLKWAPKRIVRVLWVLPALRLLLPFSLEGEALAMVLRHEHCHLKAGDHIWKLLGYLILSVYWFNPFAWLGYVLFCRDTELAL